MEAVFPTSIIAARERRSGPRNARKIMTERDWEMYRLSVVERLPEGPYKDAVIAGIKQKLNRLDQTADPAFTKSLPLRYSPPR